MSIGELLIFIQKDMRMSADYQPRIIIEILKNKYHSITRSQIAAKLFPELPIKQAVQRCNKMPFKVLKDRGVIGLNEEFVYLTVWPAPEAPERRKLIKACRDRLTKFNTRKSK